MENKQGLSSPPPASTLETPQEREETHNWKALGRPEAGGNPGGGDGGAGGRGQPPGQRRVGWFCFCLCPTHPRQRLAAQAAALNWGGFDWGGPILPGEEL